MKLVFRLLVGIIFAGFAATAASAAAFDLLISGNITRYTDASLHQYRMSEREFLALPERSIQTSTNWTPRSVWQGPLLLDILNRVGGHGTVLQMYALDDYKVEIPVSDLRKYGVILAYAKDGNRLAVNGFGPFMVIYPRDQYPEELNKASAEKRFIWQVWKIVVK